MSLEKVHIIEMGPRDGLQNESQFIPTEMKIAFIKDLIKAGYQSLEVTSFVNPKALPQMADASSVLAGLSDQQEQFFWALIPNLKGFENARKVNLKGFAFFAAASEQFSQKNINASIDQSLNRLAEFSSLIRPDEKLRGYISCCFGCPYQGDVAISSVLQLIEKLLEHGVCEVSLGDTIGVARPKQVQTLLKEVQKIVSLDRIALHFHDTRGMAVANVLASLQMGVRTFDASAGGLGGCPYAKGATGNVATEDLIYLFEDLGLDHGLNLDQVIAAAQPILKFLNKPSPSRFHQVYLSQID